MSRSFERAKESWQLDGDQKLEQAKLFKEKGTNFFKQEKYTLAAKKYKKIIEFLEHEISLKGELCLRAVFKKLRAFWLPSLGI